MCGIGALKCFSTSKASVKAVCSKIQNTDLLYIIFYETTIFYAHCYVNRHKLKKKLSQSNKTGF